MPSHSQFPNHATSINGTPPNDLFALNSSHRWQSDGSQSNLIMFHSSPCLESVPNPDYLNNENFTVENTTASKKCILIVLSRPQY
jgi:hypothetical protein